jgi:uncharacterized UBP type Zn finger protein
MSWSRPVSRAPQGTLPQLSNDTNTLCCVNAPLRMLCYDRNVGIGKLLSRQLPVLHEAARDLVGALLERTPGVYSVKRLYEEVIQNHGVLNIKFQQDAHEVLVFLMEFLDDHMRSSASPPPPSFLGHRLRLRCFPRLRVRGGD